MIVNVFGIFVLKYLVNIGIGIIINLNLLF